MGKTELLLSEDGNQQHKYQVKSTVDNSVQWRVWHGVNYMLGGLLFVAGSFVYYPSIYPKVDGFVLGGWLFTIGSTNFLIADFTEWMHFKNYSLRTADDEHKKGAIFKDYELGINFFISMMGSLLYLIGSIMFIPATNMLAEGE